MVGWHYKLIMVAKRHVLKTPFFVDILTEVAEQSPLCKETIILHFSFTVRSNIARCC